MDDQPSAEAGVGGVRMSKRVAVRLAWTLCAFIVALSAIGLALTLPGPNAPRLAPALVKTVLEAFVPMVFGVVGALIVAHQPRNTIGWLLMVIALAWTTGGVLASFLPVLTAPTPNPTPAMLLNTWFSQWSWWLLIGPLLLILVLFPTGRPPSPRWHWVIVAVGALFGTFLILATFSETITATDTNIRLHNPFGIIPDSVENVIFSGPWLIMLLTTVALCVAAVFVRYRRAAAQERAQIKWFLYASMVFQLIYSVGVFISDDVLLNAWSGIVFNLAALTPPASASPSCATGSTILT